MNKLTFHVSKTSGGWVGTAYSGKGLIANTVPLNSKTAAEEKLLEYLELEKSPKIIKNDPLAETIQLLWDGKKGKKKPTFDFSVFSEKQIMVLKHVEQIAPGKVLSYGKVAEELGLGQAARFVGNCMSTNRFPLLIPCHRVIKSDGSLGKYGAGAGVSDKKRLLKEEGWLK
ncbi:MAG: MGMT family protein [Candidatus Kariarchaeaceae archaeon]